MDELKVMVSPSTRWTRVLVTHGADEILRAVLPPPSQVRHERAAKTFLESLALWLDQTLVVALSVDAGEEAFCLGLTDVLGIGERSVFYRVNVISRGGRRRRGKRLRGVGEFSDLRQLRLVPDGEAV